MRGLFHNSLEQLASESGLAPLELRLYQTVSGTDFEPHILLVYEHEEDYLTFRIRFASGRFITRIKLNSLDDLPGIRALISDLAGFQESEDFLFIENSPAEVQNALIELAQALAATSSETSTHAWRSSAAQCSGRNGAAPVH